MRLAWLVLAALLTSASAALATEPPLASAADIANIVAPLLPATVSVSTVHITQGKDGPKRETAAGSGFIIDPAGLIVTNNHVVDGAAEVSVTLHDKTVLPATVVGQDDLTERLVMTSRQYGIEPQQLFGYLQENNQLPAMFADVRRGLTMAAVVEAATVTDTDGNTVDTSEFFGRRGESAEADADEVDEADESGELVAQEASDQAAT